jgi:serine protease Do
MTTSLRLAERPSKDEIARAGQGDSENTGKLGVDVQNVTPDIAQQLKIGSGAVVENVEPGSPADIAGLQSGDVIHKVNNVRVTNRADLVRAMRTLGDQQQAVLQVETQGKLRFVTVTFD